jgi:hypothetical protein
MGVVATALTQLTSQVINGQNQVAGPSHVHRACAAVGLDRVGAHVQHDDGLVYDLG